MYHQHTVTPQQLNNSGSVSFPLNLHLPLQCYFEVNTRHPMISPVNIQNVSLKDKHSPFKTYPSKLSSAPKINNNFPIPSTELVFAFS